MTKKFLNDIAVFRTNKSSARRIRKRTSQQKIDTIARHRIGVFPSPTRSTAHTPLAAPPQPPVVAA